MDITELKKALFDGGVVGAGGAGFPTHAKLSEQADTIILNCAECEPLIKVDRLCRRGSFRYAVTGRYAGCKGRHYCS